METLYSLELSDRKVSVILRYDEKSNNPEHLLRVEVLNNNVTQIVREEIIEYMDIDSIVANNINEIK